MQGRLLLLAVALAVAASCVAAASSAQQGTDTGGAVPSCAAKLVPCAAYLNATTAPPAACCDPLKDAAANETACMCAMLLNEAAPALRAFGVAPEQGLGLAKRCGVTTDASACATSGTTAAAAGASGAATATGSGTAASSASTGGSASSVTKPTANGGATCHLSLTGASVLVGFSFIWCAIMV